MLYLSRYGDIYNIYEGFALEAVSFLLKLNVDIGSGYDKPATFGYMLRAPN
jgi:hypothetical protein